MAGIKPPVFPLPVALFRSLTQFRFLVRPQLLNHI